MASALAYRDFRRLWASNPAFISVGALLAGSLSDLLGVRGASFGLAAAAAVAVVLLYVLSAQPREMRLK